MEIAGTCMIILIQVIIYLFCLSVYFPFSRITESKITAQNSIKVLVSLGVFCCFRFAYNENDVFIFPEEGFEEYMVLTLTSFLFLWLVRIREFVTYRWLFPITQLMLGICFWMSLFTCIKFVPILGYSLFPLLGAMVITPYFVLTISVFEINRLTPLHGKLIFPRVISFSFAVLIIFQLLMNIRAETPWQLIRIFTLHYSII